LNTYEKHEIGVLSSAIRLLFSFQSKITKSAHCNCWGVQTAKGAPFERLLVFLREIINICSAQIIDQSINKSFNQSINQSINSILTTGTVDNIWKARMYNSC
jgi:hypothetical protein